jgi:hypothetical protein
MNVYMMDDERFQPFGIAVYRDEAEVEDVLQGIDDSDAFWSALKVVDIDESKIPANGFFPTRAAFEEARRTR